jgi:nitric oxide reductase activation protein
MDEDLEQKMAELVASLSPESYERFGPGLREAGLALAERRELERVRGVYEQAGEDFRRALEDWKRARERSENALRLLEDAL